MKISDEYSALEATFKERNENIEALTEASNIILNRARLIREEVMLERILWWENKVEHLNTSNLGDLEFLIAGMGEFAYSDSIASKLDKMIQDKLTRWVNAFHPLMKWNGIWNEERKLNANGEPILFPMLIPEIRLSSNFLEAYLEAHLGTLAEGLLVFAEEYRALYPKSTSMYGVNIEIASRDYSSRAKLNISEDNIISIDGEKFDTPKKLALIGARLKRIEWLSDSHNEYY